MRCPLPDWLAAPWPALRPRRDEYRDRLTFFNVYIGDTDAGTHSIANALCTSYNESSADVSYLTCDTPLVGRYVVVHLQPLCTLPASAPALRDGVLNLCEVEVYGEAAPATALPPPPTTTDIRFELRCSRP